MSVTRWDPFRDLLALQERMARLFEQTLSRSRSPAEVAASGSWAPAVDLYETERSLVLKAELPEVDHKDIEVRVHNNRLTLLGERRMKEEVKQDHFQRTERAFGPFSRTFTLPTSVESESVKAEFKNGILKVTMPKLKEGQSRPIQIKTI